VRRGRGVPGLARPSPGRGRDRAAAPRAAGGGGQRRPRPARLALAPTVHGARSGHGGRHRRSRPLAAGRRRPVSGRACAACPPRCRSAGSAGSGC
jgi:hypothetical protein